jgi:hypothetical protein
MSPAESLATDRATIGAFLTRATRRMGVLALAEGAMAGIGLATILLALGWPGRTAPLTPVAAGLMAALFAGFVRVRLISRDPWRIAAKIEARAPRSRNLIFSAVEQAVSAPGPAGEGYVSSVIAARAAALARELDPAALFPLGRRAIALPAIAAIWLATIAFATGGHVLGRIATSEPTIDRIDVIITPPAYARRPAVTERNPDRIRALEGSRIELRVRSNAQRIDFAQGDWNEAPSVDAAGVAIARLVVTGDGFVSMTPSVMVKQGDAPSSSDSTPRSGATRLLGISVDRDLPPTVRIPSPGKDLLVADGKRALDIAIEAGDDIGLASLKLRYTKVSGSGERFTFKEAEVPIEVAKPSAVAWTSRLRWSLDSLGLESGDMVVYRAVVTDARPGAVPIESDAFIVEIVAPGGVAEAGYSVDPEEERTALSQQMVVLKTQRLLARKTTTPAEAYSTAALEIGYEQRRVRAEFVFLMGGEMSDGGAAASDTSMTDINEEEDAAAEEDIMAGRQLNQGRIALLRAIRAMSLASRSLNEADLATALTHEREAVKQLELAFSKNRILLRAFSQREALDTTRRLSGDLSGLARSERAMARPVVAERAQKLRDLADGIESFAAREGTNELRARGVTEFAVSALRLDASDRAMQAIAADLNEAAAAWRRGQESAARAATDRAVLGIVTQLVAEQGRVGGASPTLDARATRGALGDLLRGRQP